MNIDKLLNRIISMITRSAMNAGVKTVSDHLRETGKDGAPLTEAERKHAKAADEMTKKIKKMQKINRRMR